MGRKKKVAEPVEQERLEVIPGYGIPTDLAREMLEDLSELNVMQRALATIKGAASVVRVRVEELLTRVTEWGSGHVPAAREKPVQLELYRSLGDKFRWLDELEDVRGYWKKASEIHDDFAPDWVADAQEAVQDDHAALESAPDNTLPLFQTPQGQDEAQAPGEARAEGPRPNPRDPAPCGTCQGTGVVEQDGTVSDCPTCKALGVVPPEPQQTERTEKAMAELARLESLAWQFSRFSEVDFQLRRVNKFLQQKKPTKAEAVLQQIRNLLEPAQGGGDGAA